MILRFASLAAALGGLLLAVAPAAADTVTYSTTFQFTTGPGTGTNTATVGAATFKLVGFTDTVTTPEGSAKFGTIQFQRNGQSALVFGSYDFKLTINQVAPAGSVTSLTNQFSGAVSAVGGLVSVVFNAGPPLQIGNITYAPEDLDQFLSGNSGTASIMGTVTAGQAAANAVPLPMAAWGGIALCGMVGMSKFRRRSQLEM
jgi:hypothetical protein